MAIFNDLITTAEARQITGYHPDYVGALIRSGKIYGVKKNRQWLVSRKDLNRHLMSKHYVSAETVVKPFKKTLYAFLVLLIAGVATLLILEFISFSKQSDDASVIKEKPVDTNSVHTFFDL